MGKWTKKRPISGKNKYYSIANKLRRDRKTSEEFEVMLNNLKLEEIIALKLELATRLVDGKLYGIPILHSLPLIVKDAAIKYALSATRTKGEAARFLGIDSSSFFKLCRKHKIESFFEESAENEENT